MRRRLRIKTSRVKGVSSTFVQPLEPRLLLHHSQEDPIFFDDDGNVIQLGPIGPAAVGMGQTTITYSTLADGMPILNSRPTGASGAMFLDFDGDSTLNPNGVASVVYDLDGDTTTFNAAEQADIVETWRKLSIYYSMFDINVTTIQPDVANVPTAWQVISSSWSGGGVAYVSTYGSTIARAWSSEASGGSGTQTTVAHESGHVLGLQHQSLYDLLGNQINEYRGALDTAHGPIIGNSGGQINKWIFGLTTSSTTLQDDIQTMANRIKTGAKPGYAGDGFATDDYGNTLATAYALPVVGTTSQATAGVIERYSDADAFSFTSTGGNYSIAVTRDYPSGLDAKISIFDTAGNLLAAQDGNPTDFTQRLTNDQYITFDLASGTYYVVVESHGNMGDLGTYLVSVNALPTGWQSQSLGSNAIPGFSTYDATSGKFTVTGGGTDITATSGGHQFAYQTLSGDGSIIARVSSLVGGTALARAGLMIRDVFATGSRFVSLAMTLDRGPALSSRSTLNATGTTTVGATSVGFTATWLKLTRVGNVFSAFTSADGTNWTQYGTNLTIALSSTAYIGLMSTAATTLSIATGTLDNVSLTGSLNPLPTLNALAAPTNVALTNVAGTTATVGWTAVSGATGYSIERSSDGVIYTVVGTVGAVTTYNSTAMWDGDRFFFRVRASNASGVSTPSTVVSAATLPGVATGMTIAAVSPTQLVVSWADVDAETGYRIERSTDQNVWTTAATVGANINSYTDSGLTTNTRYYYRIVSIQAGTDVATSTTVNGSTRITGAVTGLGISDATTSAVSIAWAAVALADNYRIDRATDGVNFTTLTTVSSSTLSYTDTGRSAFTKYYYRVYGVNATSGSLTQTAATFAATVSTLPPSSPWVFKEFGSLPGKGIAQESSGTFTVVTSGTGIGSTLDRGGMLYQQLSGDVSITARVSSIGSNISFTGTTAGNAAGVMIREDLSDNGKMIFARRTNTNTLAVEYRTGTGVVATTVGSITSSSAWFRITRSGNTFTAEYSSNGTTWTALTTVVLAMSRQVYVGLASESDTSALLTNSSFTNVSITGSNTSFNAALVGNGLKANTNTSGGQFAPAVAADAAGNYIVAWADDGGAIRAQRYAAAGTAVGSEFRVDSLGGTNSAPTVAVDASGNFVIAWVGTSAGDANIYSQRYDSSGTLVGTQTTAVNTTTTNSQNSPFVAIAPTGAYVIAWVSANQDGSGAGVYVQRFTSTGTKSGTETKVNTVTTGDQNQPRIAVDSAGNYVIVWTSAAQDGALGGIYAKRYNSSGTVLTADFLVNQTTADDQSAPSVAAAGNGTLLVAWASNLQDGGGYGIMARLYSSTGAALTNEFAVNQYTAGNQNAPSVAVDSAGNFLVAWQSAGQDGSGWGVYGRRFDAAGIALTREFRIHTTTADDQTAPAPALSAYGTGAVAWQSNNEDGSGLGVYFRLLGNNAAPTTTGPGSVTVQPSTPAVIDVFALFADTSDSDDFLTYTVVGNTNPTLIAQTAVDYGLGTLTATPTAGLGGSAVITIRATDTAGLYVETTFTITVNATNQQPTDLVLSSTTIAENSAVNVVVGNFTTTDPDSGDTFTYTLVDGTGSTDNASFNILNGALRANTSFDFETYGSYSIRVRTTDAGGLFTEKVFTITVANVNEAPSDVAISNSTVAENAGANATVGTLGTADVDTGDTFTYTLVSGAGGDDNAAFNILGGVLRANANFDFETKSSYSIRVRSTDAAGLFFEKAFAVSVTNVNEAPADAALSNSTLAENAGTNATVGTLSTTDVDAADTFTYTLVSGTGGTDNTAFNIFGSTLRANGSFDFETKSSYSVRIRATDAAGLFFEKAFAIAVTNVNESPTDAAISNSTIAENAGANATVGTLSTTDVDAGDTFTYTLVSGTGSTDNTAFNVSGSTLRASGSFDFETKSSYSVRIRATDAGGSFTEKVFAIVVMNVNEAPSDVGLTNSSVAENAGTNATIGSLSSTDVDAGDTFIYTLVSGTGSGDNTTFSISGSTLRASGSFDFETKNSYSIRVRTTDAAGLFFEKIFAVSVTNVNESPTAAALSNSTVAENAGANATVGLLSTTDVDAGDTFTYTLVSGTGSGDNTAFNVSGSTLRANASFDFETKNSYSVRVRTTDAAGLFFEKVFAVAVTNVNENPTDVALSGNTIAENAGTNASVGTFSTTDVDAGDTFTYTLVSGTGGTDNTAFNILNGVLRANVGFDFETKSSYGIRVRSTDVGGLFTEKVFTVTVTNVNEMPTDVALSKATIAENAGTNATIGSLSSTDVDAGDTFTYTLVSGTGSADNAAFNISGSTLRASGSFDFETKSSYSIRVRTTDAAGLFFEKVFAVTVTNVNETPTDVTLSNAAITENTGTNSTIGTLGTSDPDVDDTFTYALISGPGSNDNVSFNILNGVLRANAGFDFETKSSYSIRVQSTDAGGFPTVKIFTITVTNVNEAPTNVALSKSTIAENAGANATVGTLSTSDVDVGDTFIYQLVSGTGGDDNAAFNIVDNTLRANAGFDFESNAGYFIRIRAVDAGGLATEKAFTITVTNVNEAPSDVTSSNSSVRENAGANAALGSFSAVDPDAGDTFTYALVDGTGGDDNTAFNLVGATLRAGASFDYETKSSYSIRVRATDAGGLSTEKVLSVTVTDENEAPTGVALSKSTIVENAGTNATIGTLSTIDVDAGDTFTYAIVAGAGGDDNGAFNIVGSSLQAAASFDFESKSHLSIRISTTDAGGHIIESVFTITVTDVNETPADVLLSAAVISENGIIDAFIGTLSTVDVDGGDSFTYTLTSGAGDTDNDAFRIVSNTLVAASSFDYESKNSYSVRIRTSDAGGNSVEKEFTIAVADDNEAPIEIALSAEVAAENSGADSTIAALSTFDQDGNETFTYTLVDGFGGDDNAAFRIVGSTLHAKADFDFETQQSYSVRVRSTDAGGLSVEQVFTITVIDVPEAPVLTGAGNFTTVTEDDVANNGNLVSSLVAGFLTVQAGEVAGIAVTETENGSGKWQASFDDGATWVDVGSVSTTAALLLGGNDRLRFVPNGVNGESVSLRFHGWIQSTDLVGRTVDIFALIGTLTLGVDEAAAQLVVTSRNDAPVLNASKSPVLVSVAEDAAPSGPVGTLVSQLIDFAASAGGVDNLADVDNGAAAGIAVTAANTSSGTWFYTIDGGTHWLPLGSVSNSSARLLAADGTTRIFFKPGADFAGILPSALTFRAWDRTTGANGGTANMAVSGGATAFSTAVDTASITVTAVNDSPVLLSDKSPVLTTINEDAIAPSGAVGTLVSNLARDSGSLKNVADNDVGALTGIAVIGADTTKGNWYYSINDGANWNLLGLVSNTGARLLAADAVTRLYFKPAANFNGTMTAAITFRAWDRTSGVNGGLVSTATNGGTSAFSTATDTASIVVTADNDAPKLDATKSPALVKVNEDAEIPAGKVGTLVSALVHLTGSLKNVSEVDTGAETGIAVIGGETTKGTWYYSLDDGAAWNPLGKVGTAGARLLAADVGTRLYFKPALNFSGQVADAITFRAWDRTSGANGGFVSTATNGGTTAFSSATDTASLVITAVNDAPVLDTTKSPALAPFKPNAANPVGKVGTLIDALVHLSGSLKNVSDVDAWAKTGIAITAASTSGTWFYSLNNGSTWAALGTVSAASAKLLAADGLTRLYFKPNANFKGTIASAITFRAWDRTMGVNGSNASVGVGGDTTAFSKFADTASIVVG
jgi:regulation of enolase protein 1 (concanavalin A-like superfamily)